MPLSSKPLGQATTRAVTASRGGSNKGLMSGWGPTNFARSVACGPLDGSPLAKVRGSGCQRRIFGGKSLHGTHQNSEADVAKSSKAIQPGNARRLAHGFPFATTNTPSSSSHHHHRHPLHYCTLSKPSRPLPPSNFPILVICLLRTLCPAAAIESSVAGPRKGNNTITKSRRVSLLTVDTAHSSDFRDTFANTKTSFGFRQTIPELGVPCPSTASSLST